MARYPVVATKRAIITETPTITLLIAPLLLTKKGLGILGNLGYI